MSSLKRRMENIMSPPRKEKTPTFTAVRGPDQNGHQALVGHLAFRDRSPNLRMIKKKRICLDVMDKENRGFEVGARFLHPGGCPIRPRCKQMFEEDQGLNREPLSPRRDQIDNYFTKCYKTGSPTKKRAHAKKPPSIISDKICVDIEGLEEEPDVKRMLLERSNSVCKINTNDGGLSATQGTGSVLTENYIITCSHLLRGFLDGTKLKKGTKVSVLFKYRDPQLNSTSLVCTVEEQIVAINEDLDYAILKLKPDVHDPKHRVPPGLLEQFGPIPEEGKIFIIGYPRGGEKRMDSTCIIEFERRTQAVINHLAPYQDYIFHLLSITQIIEKRDIQHILFDGVKANQVVTYNTKLYEGASGSPVLDAQGRVFGLHSGGYGYGFPVTMDSVLEFSYRLCLIISDLVCRLKESGNFELLKRIEFLASKNEFLKKALESEPIDQPPKE